MTVFDTLDGLAGRAVNRVFGEIVEVLPMVVSQHRGASRDPERPVRKLCVRFALMATDEPLQGARRGTELQGMTRQVQDIAQITIEAADLATLGYALAAEDRIVRPNRDVYALSSPHRADTGAMTWSLTLESSA